MLEEEVKLEEVEDLFSDKAGELIEKIVGSSRTNGIFYLHFFSNGVDKVYDISYRNGLRNLGDYEFLDLNKTRINVFVSKELGNLGNRIYEAKARLTREVVEKGGTHGVGYNLGWDEEGNVSASAVPVKIYDSSKYVERT